LIGLTGAYCLIILIVKTCATKVWNICIGSGLAVGHCGRMNRNDRIADSVSNQQRRSELGCKQGWAELTSKYLHELPQQLDGIRARLEVKDYATIKKQAHRIKGTSGTYRLEAIAKSAAQLERLAESQNAKAIATVINKVKRLVERQAGRLNSQAASANDRAERNTNG